MNKTVYLLFKYEYLEWLNEIVLPHYIQPWNKKLLGVFNNSEDAQKGVPEGLLYNWSFCRGEKPDKSIMTTSNSPYLEADNYCIEAHELLNN